jgi:hypothetical protein
MQVDWIVTEEYMLIEQLHKDPDAAGKALAVRSLAQVPRMVANEAKPSLVPQALGCVVVVCLCVMECQHAVL